MRNNDTNNDTSFYVAVYWTPATTITYTREYHPRDTICQPNPPLLDHRHALWGVVPQCRSAGSSWRSARGYPATSSGSAGFLLHRNLLAYHDLRHWNCGAGQSKPYLICARHIQIYYTTIFAVLNVLASRSCNMDQVWDTPKVAPSVLEVTQLHYFHTTRWPVFCCSMLQPSPQSLSALHAM